MNMKYFLAFFLFSLCFEAYSSDSDKLCAYVESRSSSNPKKKKEAMDDLASIANILMEIPELEKSALEQKMTFKMFQQFVESKKKINVPTSYEAAYNTNYIKKYCGSLKTEATSLTINGKALTDPSKIYQNQFDPKSHKYYQEIPSKGSQ